MELQPPSARPRSNLFRLEKPRALAQRLRGLRDKRPAAAPGAISLLQAINGVARDLSPEDIRSLSDEEASALFGAIMDQQSRESAVSPESVAPAVVRISRARLRNIERLQGKPLRRSVLAEGKKSASDPARIVFEGIPGNLRRISGAGTVFRHYVRSIDHLISILAAKELQNAGVPYVRRPIPEVNEIYPDASGAFLTDTRTGSDAIGRSSSHHFVDVRIPAELPVMEAAGESVYFVPLPNRTPFSDAWDYLRWATGNAPGLNPLVKAAERSGGLGARLGIAVEVVGFGRQGDSGLEDFRGRVRRSAEAEGFEPMALLRELAKDKLIGSLLDSWMTGDSSGELVWKKVLKALERFEAGDKNKLMLGKLSLGAMRLLIAAGSFGSVPAHVRGQPEREKEFSRNLAEAILRHLGLSDGEIRWAMECLGSDPVPGA